MNRAIQIRKGLKNFRKITFPDLVTLTIELDLDMVDFHVKFLVRVSNSSFVRDSHFIGPIHIGTNSLKAGSDSRQTYESGSAI